MWNNHVVLNVWTGETETFATKREALEFIADNGGVSEWVYEGTVNE